MSLRERLGADALTHLVAEPTIMSDRFETQVFYAGAIRKFLMIDRYAKPRSRNWVAVNLTAEKVCIERFRGQRHFGVVQILKRFQFYRSVFWLSVHGLIWFIATTI